MFKPNPFRQAKILYPLLEAAQELVKENKEDVRQQVREVYQVAKSLCQKFIVGIEGSSDDRQLYNVAEELVFPLVAEQIKKDKKCDFAHLETLIQAFIELYKDSSLENPVSAYFDDLGIHDLVLHSAGVKSKFLEFARVLDKMPENTVGFYLNGFTSVDFINTVYYHLQQNALEVLAYGKKEDFEFTDNLAYKSCMNTFSNIAVGIVKDVLNARREVLVKMREMPKEKQGELVKKMKVKNLENKQRLLDMRKYGEPMFDTTHDNEIYQLSGISLLSNPAIPKGMCTALDDIVKRLRGSLMVILPDVFRSEEERVKTHTQNNQQYTPQNEVNMVP